MSVTIPSPRDLQALLATMESAKEQRVNMNIWDRDIKAVRDAIVFIEAMRLMSSIPRPDRGAV